MYNVDGSIDECNVCLVILWNKKIDGIYYNQNFDLIVMMVSVLIFLVIVGVKSWVLYLMGIYYVFLYMYLDKEVYIKILLGFIY